MKNLGNKIHTPPWVFFTFSKLYKSYQIVQDLTNHQTHKPEALKQPETGHLRCMYHYIQKKTLKLKTTLFDPFCELDHRYEHRQL